MNKKTKAYIAGIAIIISSIAGCTYSLVTNDKTASEAIAESVEGIQKGISTIQSEETK